MTEGMISLPNGRMCMDLQNAVEECFPNNSKNIMRLISFRKSSDGGLEESEVRDIPKVLGETGHNRKGMLRIQKLLGRDEQPLAMEYTGPYGDIPGYHSGVEWDWRPWANAIMLSDRDGTPTGMVPVGCRRMREWEPFKSLKGIDCTVVTDRMPYYRETTDLLESLGLDYLLVERPFPISCFTLCNLKMQDLRHNGVDYKTYKGRYDKKWIFRFTDPIEAERIIGRMDEMKVEQRDRDFFKRSAGVTDVLSNTGHDLREVRNLIDIRDSTDRIMRYHRRLMAEDSHLLENDDAVMGYLFVSMMSARGDVPPLE